MEKITLTPKEKAEQLVNKMLNNTTILVGSRLIAKEQAIIVVDEILDLNYPAETLEDLDDHLTYWDLVIDEIKKL